MARSSWKGWSRNNKNGLAARNLAADDRTQFLGQSGAASLVTGDLESKFGPAPPLESRPSVDRGPVSSCPLETSHRGGTRNDLGWRETS